MALKKCKKHARRSILHRWRTFGDQLNVLWESITLQCKYIDETISLKDFLIFIRRRRRKLCNSNITFSVTNIPLIVLFYQFLFFGQTLNRLIILTVIRCRTSRAVFRSQSDNYDGAFLLIVKSF